MSIDFKLEQLRARTDQELAAIIDRELDRALTLARSADPQWASAARANTQVRNLLPKLYNLGERLRLERKSRELRDALDARWASEQPRLRAAAC